MKEIVLSALGVLAVSIGVYCIALLAGVGQYPALMFFFATLIAASVISPGNATVILGGAAAFAVILATIIIIHNTHAAAALIAPALTVATIVSLVEAVKDAAALVKQEGLRFGWAIVVYAIEWAAIVGALVVGNVGWSIVVILAGIAALLLLWRISPEPKLEEGHDR